MYAELGYWTFDNYWDAASFFRGLRGDKAIIGELHLSWPMAERHVFFVVAY